MQLIPRLYFKSLCVQLEIISQELFCVIGKPKGWVKRDETSNL